MSWKYTGLSWDGMKHFIDNEGSAAASIVIPGWSIGEKLSKALTGNSTTENAAATLSGEGAKVVSKAYQNIQNLGSVGIDTLKKYWYVPVVIGGVIIGYRAIGAERTNQLLAAVAASKN